MRLIFADSITIWHLYAFLLYYSILGWLCILHTKSGPFCVSPCFTISDVPMCEISLTRVPQYPLNISETYGFVWKLMEHVRNSHGLSSLFLFGCLWVAPIFRQSHIRYLGASNRNPEHCCPIHQVRRRHFRTEGNLGTSILADCPIFHVWNPKFPCFSCSNLIKCWFPVAEMTIFCVKSISTHDFFVGWWFGTWLDYDFPYIIGNVIIPTDEVRFFRGVGQPPIPVFFLPNPPCPWVQQPSTTARSSCPPPPRCQRWSAPRPGSRQRSCPSFWRRRRPGRRCGGWRVAMGWDGGWF